MRPENDPDDPARKHRGIAQREEGQQRALARAADWRGFTETVPSVEAAARELTSRLSATRLGRAACETLAVLLHAPYPAIAGQRCRCCGSPTARSRPWPAVMNAACSTISPGCMRRA